MSDSTQLTFPQRLTALSLADFQAAIDRIGNDIVRTPLLPSTRGERDIRLKPECLQPLGSFKIRCAANALSALSDAELAAGIATASAGNFAQGLGLAAKRRGIALTVHVPDTAARRKVQAIGALGARVVTHTFPDWWRIVSTRSTGCSDGVFVHPFCDANVILGNGSIGLELLADWPQLETIVVPFGGGGLISGISLACRAQGRRVRIVACEIETSTPLAAAFAAGRPVTVERAASFVDGIGSNSVLPEMWPVLRELVDEVIVVSTDEARQALRDLAVSHHLVTEGAGAVALAAARSDRCPGQRVAAVISGGNIDEQKLCEILTSGSVRC